MRLSSALVAAAAAMLVAGCGSQKQVIVTKQGTATVETNRNTGTATITTKQGTATYGKNAVDPAKLGLPVYPGASASEGGGLSVQSSQGSQQMVLLTTGDSFDKVYGWYKNQMPADSEKMHLSAAGSSMATFAIGASGDKQSKSVMITSGKGKTNIELMAGSKTN